MENGEWKVKIEMEMAMVFMFFFPNIFRWEVTRLGEGCCERHPLSPIRLLDADRVIR